MQIFNRYGKLIFESTRTDVGWDGTIDGDPVPMGSYGIPYHFYSYQWRGDHQKGNVTVIR